MKKKTPGKYKSDVKPPSPRWDLYRDGLSQSLMSKFIECRESFRLYTVCGYRERGIRRARDYGTIFHKMIELHSMGTLSNKVLSEWVKKKYRSLSRSDFEATWLDTRIAMTQFELYRKAFKKKYVFLDAEPVFKIPYKLPNGKTVLLRGRMDEVIDKGARGIAIQENKTKQRIDMTFIEDTLRSNLQTMLYAHAAQIIYGRPVVEIVYNVIRQPSLRKKQDESEDAFIKRVKEDIDKRKSHYFQRRLVDLDKAHIEHWRKTELDPLLEHIVAWWESIKHNPFDPWHLPDGRVNPMHFARPFGIYSPMSNGRGDYYDYKITGKLTKLEVAESAFDELDDEEESDE